MKAKIGRDGWICFWCPGCNCAHRVPVKPLHHSGWVFNGDLEKPTLSPSILVRYPPKTPDTPDNPHPRCHSFVRDGKIQLLSDCTHQLAGKTVDLPEWTKDEYL